MDINNFSELDPQSEISNLAMVQAWENESDSFGELIELEIS
jgi:hypothetical protein